MLTHPTHERLIALGLTGMAKALEEQRRQSDLAALDFEERLALMVDRETIERENKRLVARLKFARLRQSAIVEDINMKAPRSLDKALSQKLVAGDWIERHQNLLSSDKPESARVSSPARSATRPAATTALSSTIACHGCSTPCCSRAVMDATAVSSKPWRASRS